MVRDTTKNKIKIPSKRVGFIGNDSVVPGKTIKLPNNCAKHTRYPKTNPKNNPIPEIKIPSIKKIEKIFCLVNPILNREFICFFFSTKSMVREAIKLKAERIKINIKIQMTMIFSD